MTGGLILQRTAALNNFSSPKLPKDNSSTKGRSGDEIQAAYDSSKSFIGWFADYYTIFKDLANGSGPELSELLEEYNAEQGFRLDALTISSEHLYINYKHMLSFLVEIKKSSQGLIIEWPSSQSSAKSPNRYLDDIVNRVEKNLIQLKIIRRALEAARKHIADAVKTKHSDLTEYLDKSGKRFGTTENYEKFTPSEVRRILTLLLQHTDLSGGHNWVPLDSLRSSNKDLSDVYDLWQSKTSHNFTQTLNTKQVLSDKSVYFGNNKYTSAMQEVFGNKKHPRSAPALPVGDWIRSVHDWRDTDFVPTLRGMASYLHEISLITKSYIKGVLDELVSVADCSKLPDEVTPPHDSGNNNTCPHHHHKHHDGSKDKGDDGCPTNDHGKGHGHNNGNGHKDKGDDGCPTNDHGKDDGSKDDGSKDKGDDGCPTNDHGKGGSSGKDKDKGGSKDKGDDGCPTNDHGKGHGHNNGNGHKDKGDDGCPTNDHGKGHGHNNGNGHKDGSGSINGKGSITVDGSGSGQAHLGGSSGLLQGAGIVGLTGVLSALGNGNVWSIPANLITAASNMASSFGSVGNVAGADDASGKTAVTSASVPDQPIDADSDAGVSGFGVDSPDTKGVITPAAGNSPVVSVNDGSHAATVKKTVPVVIPSRPRNDDDDTDSCTVPTLLY